MRVLVIVGLWMVLVAPAMGRDRIFDAIVEVESGGNPNAVGDGGKAHGLAQAWGPAWREGCEALGVHWDYVTGVRDLRKCNKIFHAYTSLYGARTDQQRARIWKGGPRGDRRRSTLPYWRKVSLAMRRMK